MEDVARASGLSRAQVSRAIRGDPGVHAETLALARSTAEKIGYVPNLAARSLATARGSNVGLIIGEPLNPFHMLLAREIDAALSLVNYDTVVSLRVLDENSSISEGERLRSLRVVGLILLATPHEDRAISRVASGIPCVYLGKDVPDPHISTIRADNHTGVSKAVGYLIDLGHRNIAYIAGGLVPGSRERHAAYAETMAASGLKTMEVVVEPGIDGGKVGVDSLMSLNPRPTAIICHNDIVAMGAMNRLKGLGLHIPEDISVIGFDDIPYSASETLSLTTIRQDTTEQAKAAVAELCARLENSATPRRQVLPASLVVRDSVSAPRS